MWPARPACLRSSSSSRRYVCISGLREASMAVEELADSELVVRVDDRPDQANRHRLRPEAARLVDRLEDALLVQLDEHVALRVDPLADLEREVARHVGRRIVELAERVELSAFAKEQDVGEAFSREEGGARRPGFHDRVRGACRPVREDVRPREQLRDVEAEAGRQLRERLLDALKRALEISRSLGEVEHPGLVRDDDVGERPTRVDRDTEAHQAMIVVSASVQAALTISSTPVRAASSNSLMSTMRR